MAFAGQSLEQSPQLTQRLMSNTCFPRNPSGTSAFTKGYLPVAGFMNRCDSTSFIIGDIDSLFFIFTPSSDKSKQLALQSVQTRPLKEAEVSSSSQSPLGRYATVQTDTSSTLRLQPPLTPS